MDTRDQIRLAYSTDAEGYDNYRLKDARGRLLSEHDLSLFRAMLPSISANRVLEVGAGTGRFTMSVLDRGHTVVATDINEGMLQLLRRKIEEAGYDERCIVQIEDVFDLSFDANTFDLVIACHIVPRLLSVADQEAALKEMARVMAPGGYVLFNFRNAHALYSPLYRGHSIRASEVRRILGLYGLSVAQRKGKHILTRRLLNTVPIWTGKAIARVDRALWSCFPTFAWDVFVLAQKQKD